jgi:hypothetical protein
MALIGQVLKVYNTLAQYPGGKKIFSMMFAFKAPYFRTISPLVEDLKPGYGE